MPGTIESAVNSAVEYLPAGGFRNFDPQLVFPNSCGNRPRIRSGLSVRRKQYGRRRQHHFGPQIRVPVRTPGRANQLVGSQRPVISTKTDVNKLLANGTQGSPLSDLVSLALSKQWGHALTGTFNFGYMFVRAPRDNQANN